MSRALLPCLALLAFACVGRTTGPSSGASSGGTTSAGGSSNSGGAACVGGSDSGGTTSVGGSESGGTSILGGTAGEGGAIGEGGDSGVTICGCAEGDFFIELTVGGENWRFSEPPITDSQPDAPFYYPSCETFLSPAFFTGISCLPDRSDSVSPHRRRRAGHPPSRRRCHAFRFNRDWRDHREVLALRGRQRRLPNVTLPRRRRCSPGKVPGRVTTIRVQR